MWNYSSAKLELLAVKWVVMERLRDYLLGSKFTGYTDNSLLTYVKRSKLGVAQIQWLSELALLDYDIKYRTGKFNLAADTLSHYPESIEDNSSDNDSEEYETISCNVVCNDLCEIIKGDNIKRAVARE